MPNVISPPQEVAQLLLDDGVVEAGQALAIDGYDDEAPALPASRFMHNGVIALPDHGWDLNESNVTVYTHNLQGVGGGSVFSGPGVAFYEKVDPNLPAYAVFMYYEDLPMVSWVEF